MPWNLSTKMELRLEFVQLADREDANMSQLCRRFDISRPWAGYKWLGRYREEGQAGLEDRSRQPHNSPAKTPDHIEEAVCSVRSKHPAWGGRKIRAVLRRQADAGKRSFGSAAVPAASTVTAILRRRGELRKEDTDKAASHERFEKEAPNELWQMDFKGDFLLEGNQEKRCYPLTVVDDHSRFAVALAACGDQQRETVQERLREAFRRYGLPRRIITSGRGAPWGVGMARPDGGSYYTRLSAWLMRFGISVSFTARAHPQTNGKNERFNQSLGAGAGLRFESYPELSGYQERSPGGWRKTYNLERPHEALGMDVPASRYEVSERSCPEELPPVEYGQSEEEVRKVHSTGYVSFRSQRFKVGKAFGGHPVALRPTVESGKWKVYFCHQHVRTIELDQPPR
jgi:transposase InsO family protein